MIELVERLIAAGAFCRSGGPPRVIETHISVVVLAGEYALKFKKRVKLGFIDCSTLEHRRRLCTEEVRLNRRTAPEIYLGVVAISGTPEAPFVGDGGPVLEYAVRMRRFPDGATLAELVERGELSSLDPEPLADVVAAFHLGLEPCRGLSDATLAARMLRPARDNFADLRRAGLPADLQADLAPVERWSEEAGAELAQELGERARQGWFRECHGDLHLGNIVLLEGRPVLFDCVEFSRALREIDVMCEVAFLVMDLTCRGERGFARRVLNRYLERTGDYGGLRWLRFYEVYRALVRAKVAALSPSGRGQRDWLARYIGYAKDVIGAQRRPTISILHGLSGSGKSTLARGLMALAPVVAVRSDVERKRLAGRGLEARTGSALGEGLYASESTGETYRRLALAARWIVQAGFDAVIDATFLRREQRRQFTQLARDLGVASLLVHVHAPVPVLERRVLRREARGGDGSEAGIAVLHEQLRRREGLSRAERQGAIVISTERPEQVEQGLQRWVDRLG